MIDMFFVGVDMILAAGWLIIDCSSLPKLLCIFFYIDVSLMKVDCCVFFLLTRNLDIVERTSQVLPVLSPMILLTQFIAILFCLYFCI